jgi:hypothetical protein
MTIFLKNKKGINSKAGHRLFFEKKTKNNYDSSFLNINSFNTVSQRYFNFLVKTNLLFFIKKIILNIFFIFYPILRK